jgi:predicted TIM-barrel fold metal-dependent hydrolase
MVSVSAKDMSGNGYRYTDAHCHYVDFLQRTDGIQVLLEKMETAGVYHIQVMGLPVIKKWNSADPREPHYYLEDDSRTYWYSSTDSIVARAVGELSKKDRQRFHPFMCGFNPTNRNAVDHVRRMIRWYPDFWEGIGEIFTRHDDLTGLTYGETARANNIALNPIYDLAAENDMPVQMHNNIGNKWLREPVYMHEMEDAIRAHPETRFIWAHVGISRDFNIPSIIKEADRLLKTYDNLWFDLSWVVFEDNIAPEGKLDRNWISLIENYPGRFMIGTDKVGHFDTYVKEIQKYDLLLEALKPETSRLVARENFLRILPLKAQARVFEKGTRRKAANIA